MARGLLLAALSAFALFAVVMGSDAGDHAAASPGAITVREPAFGLPHIYADTDVELARENGREIAKDRLGQLVLIGRVARGTLYQAFGGLDAGTLNDDISVRRDGYTSSELNNMFEKLPADVQDLLFAYAEGVNDTIDDVYAGSLPMPAEVFLLNYIGLGDDLFGNATDISDQVDPYYRAPGGADPAHPDGGFQFTPEMVMAVAVLQVRNFGENGFGEVSRLNELNSLLGKYPSDGDEIWDDLNFLNDPLAPVSVPDANAPGFGGPLASGDPALDLPAYVSDLTDYDTSASDAELEAVQDHRQEFATMLGAWPSLGSYGWMIDGDRSATNNPWVGGFPQTGTQTPSIMHFVEMRSGEGSDHRIQTIGMEFVGAPAVLIGQTDDVAWTSTTAQLKTDDFYLEQLILENTDALRYSDEGTPAPMSMRTEDVLDTAGAATTIALWRTHERAGNGGDRTVEGFQGDRTGTADSAGATSLTDSGAFGGGSYAGGYVAITDGTGAGQLRPILSNTTDTLTLDGGDAWTTTPDATSKYVAVRPGDDIIANARARSFWLEESTTALGFSIYQRAEDVLDIRRGTRMMPSTHNFFSADHQSFNGIGTDLGAGTGNVGYYSSGFSRIRQGGTDPRLPLDGTQPDELVVVGGSVDSSAANTLTSSGAFTGEDFSPPGYNYRLDNPSASASEYIVAIVGGDGYRQTRRIASNTDDTLTLEEDWGVAPSPGDLFEIYEIVAMPEAINPPQGYSANWNNKAATTDIGDEFGRQHRVIYILEQLANNLSWSRDDQRQLNKDVAGLDGKGDFGRYLIPRIRDAVDGVGDGGNAQVEPVLEQLEAFQEPPYDGRGFVDPVAATKIAGEPQFLESLISHLSTAIYGDEFSGTSVGAPGGNHGLAMVQHAIDSAAGGPAGAYGQAYTGDYFNGSDWRVVVRDAFAQTITDLGGVPADVDRYDTTFVHPLQPLFTNLIFDPTPVGNRGTWEEIIEVGADVLGEFIFPLGQSGFIDETGVPDPNTTTLHRFWRDWRFVPMLHVAEDLTADPDGDVDNDGVLDGFEKWYFGSNSPAASSDDDGDGLTLLEEYQNVTDPTKADTEGDHCSDGRELGSNPELGGHRDPNYLWDFYDTDGDGYVGLLTDVFDVALAFGAIEGDDNYDSALDRSPPPTEEEEPDASKREAWDMGPPDGVIDLLTDVFGAAMQFGHHCV